MTPGQLKTFIAVIESGSIKGAAASLFVSQAAVSSSLSTLQEDLGVTLFDREGRGLRRTPSAEVLYSYAKRILGLLEEAELATIAESDPATQILRIGAVTTAGEVLVPRWLRSYLVERPQMKVTLEVGNKERVMDLLITHRVDLVVAGRPTRGEELASLATRRHELVLVTAAPELFPSHLEGTQNEIDDSTTRRNVAATRDELQGATWLLREVGSGTRETALELLAEMAISPRTLTIGSNGAIIDAAEVGLGIALVSREAVSRQLKEGSLHAISCDPLPLVRNFHLIVRSATSYPSAIGNFVGFLVSTNEVSLTPKFIPPGEAVREN